MIGIKFRYKLWKSLHKKMLGADPFKLKGTELLKYRLYQHLCAFGANELYQLKKSKSGKKSAPRPEFEKAFCRSCCLKESVFNQHKDEAETIVVGSSHCDYGVNPDFFHRYTLNMGSAAMDLIGVYFLMRNRFKKLPKLKNIVLLYSVFSKGYRLDKTSSKFLCIYYKKVFGIPYNTLPVTEHALEQIEEYKKTVKADKECRGYLHPTMSRYFDAKSRAESHTKNFGRKSFPIQYLDLIAKFCKKQGYRLYVAVSPCSAEYNQYIPEEIVSQMEKDVCRFVPKDRYRSFLKDTDFTTDDFFDVDHLSLYGSEKFSRKLSDWLESFEK